jgi:zinc/manganese transport system substrate-binding protein
VVVALLALVPSACSTARVGVVASPRGDRVVEVVSAESMWGSLAAQLGGDHAEVASIVSSPDADPHDYEPTAADGRTVAQAALVVENGLGYDPWMARLVAAGEVEGQRTLDVGHLLGLHDGDNPHRWYFPADVERVIDGISAAYAAIDPADAGYFARRHDELLGAGLSRYHQLLAEIRARHAGTPIGASESIVEGIADATGLRLLTPAPLLRAVAEGTEPTAHDKATADDQITNHAIEVFVYNRQNSTPDVTRLVNEAEAHHIPVTSVTETMSPSTSTFQAWQVRQLEQLARALAEAAGR